VSTSEDIRKEIDGLLPSEQEDLLRYLEKRIHAAHEQEPAQKIACEGRWLTEEESDLQYFIPETHYQAASTDRQEDE
jgi:hypothetical protein